MNFKNYIKDTYKWPDIPDKEISRLAKVLASHLRNMKIKMDHKGRTNFTRFILKKQKGTCAFADGNDKYCWNEPKDKQLSYLKLQWGHKVPISHGKESHKLGNLILLCARCNNNIQKSRSITQLIPELE